MTHDVVILAAGGSTRLGRPKQALCIHGEPLIARAIRLAQATEPRSVVVVLGAQAQQWRRWTSSVIVVENHAWDTGMASSLQAGVRALSVPALPVLILVVDQPALDAMHLQRILSAFDGNNDVVSGYGAALGVPALVRPSTLAGVHALEGDQGMRRLWSASAPVVVRDDALGLDVDTVADAADAVACGMLDAFEP